MSFQPVKPASPIGFLCEELPKVYVFSVHKIFTAWCNSLPDGISDFKVENLYLRSMSSVCCLHKSKRALRFP